MGTDAEQRYLTAMASLGDPPYRTSEVARAYGARDQRGVSVHRESLIDKGLIWSPRRGQLDFTVPLFAEYLRDTTRSPRSRRADVAVLPDLLRPGLWVVFVGTSVGVRSARAGHYYANPTNRFWDLVDAAGLTNGASLTAERDRELLDHAAGITDLVKARAASSDSLLEVGDFDVAGFLRRLEENLPTIVAFNGREPARQVARHLGQPVPAEGPLEWRVAGADGYRLPSSSGANARRPAADKTEAWRQFGRWARARRAEDRGSVRPATGRTAADPASNSRRGR
jgi:double-stranded uracil-DNA glycosylase